MMFSIKNISLTNQEWLMVFAVYVALMVFFAAVICIIYVLIRTLRLEKERQEVQSAQVVKKTTPKIRGDKVVVNVESEVTGTTRTQSPFTNISVDSLSPLVSSPELDTAKTLPVKSRSSTLSIEFENDLKTAVDYERKLVEECLMQKFRHEMEKREAEKRKVTFVEEPEILPESPETLHESSEALTPPKQPSPFVEPKQPSPIDKPMTPKQPSPIAKPITPKQPSPFIKSMTPKQPSPIAPTRQARSAKRNLNRSGLPPLKSFTPPRVLTPHVWASPRSSTLDQISLLKKHVPASRQTFKRPYNSTFM